jgi:hypothetical protein
MANKINILELDINTSALVSKMTETRNEIDKLKSAQKDLTNSNQTNSDSFTKNAVEIGRLQTSYNAQKNVIAQLSTANDNFAKATDAATQAVSKENATIADARENNKQLLALRNQVNTKTIEGKDAITAINAKLDQNNAFIKANVSAYEQQKISIGEYKKGITDAFQAINPLNGGMAGLASRATEAGGAGNLLKDSLGGAITGMWGMIKASLAFIATPIGAIIAVIAGAFLILYEIFKNFKPLLNPILDAFNALGAVFETVKSSIFALVTGAKSLKETFTSLGGEMAKATVEAYKLAAAQRAVTKEQRLLDVASAKATTLIQDYILKSKDKTATEEERIAYINKAQKIEEDINARKLKQQNAIIANARLALSEGKQISEDDMKQMAKGNSAFAQSVKNKYNLDQELIDKLRQGEIDKEGILQSHNQIIEKSQNRENKLIEDGIAAQEKAKQDAVDAQEKRTEDYKKLVDSAIQKNKDEIELYIQQQGIRKQSMADELATAEIIMNKKLALLKTEADAGKITKTAYEVESLKLKNDFARKQADVTVANANAELQSWLDNNKTKLDNNQFLNDQLYQQELDRINKESEARATAETAKLVAGTISAEQYGVAIAAIDAQTAANKKAVDDAKIQADKEKQAIDLVNQQTLDETNFQTKFALDTEREKIRYDAELLAADTNGANKDLIEQKHANNQKAIDDELQKTKIAALGATLGVVSDLLGKSSKAGKAVALAQALVNTYQGITAGVALGYPMAIPAVAMAAATGFAAVKNIVATKSPDIPKRADGGLIPTLGAGVINNGSNIIPLSNGDDTLAYVKQGEMILNQEQQRKAGGSMFFRSIGVPNFNNGGVVGGNNNLSSNNNFKIDMDILAYKLSQANKQLPPPIVSVTDIAYQSNRVQVIEAMANL